MNRDGGGEHRQGGASARPARVISDNRRTSPCPSKWIPNSDPKFAERAYSFATHLATDPGRYFVTRAESDELTAAVKRFQAALTACRSAARSAAATLVKDEARGEAEQIIRRMGHLVRANPRIDAASKVLLGMRRADGARPKHVALPAGAAAAAVRAGAARGDGATPVHELAFYAFETSTRCQAGGRGAAGVVRGPGRRRRSRSRPTRGRTTRRGRGTCGRTRGARSS